MYVRDLCRVITSRSDLNRYTAAHYLLASDKAAQDADPNLPPRTMVQRKENELELLQVCQIEALACAC